MIRLTPVYKIDDVKRKYNDYQTVYNTEEGKRVLDDLLYNSHFSKSIFDKDNQFRTHVLIGKQEIGLHILNALYLTPQEIENYKNQVKNEQKKIREAMNVY